MGDLCPHQHLSPWISNQNFPFAELHPAHFSLLTGHPGGSTLPKTPEPCQSTGLSPASRLSSSYPFSRRTRGAITTRVALLGRRKTREHFKINEISITTSVCKGFRWHQAHGDTTPQQLPQPSLIIILWQEQQPVTNEQLLVPHTSLHKNPGEIGIFPPHTGLPQRDKCHPEEEGFNKAQTFVCKSGSNVSQQELCFHHAW